MNRTEFINAIPDCQKDWIRMRLSKKIRLNGECWEWTGSGTSKGYGGFSIKHRQVSAHRAAYAMWIGPLDPKLTIDHLCRNRRCINPGHLEQVTMRENNLRSESPTAIHAKKEVCPKGHPFAPEIRKNRVGRFCLECKSQYNRAYKQRAREARNGG